MKGVGDTTAGLGVARSRANTKNGSSSGTAGIPVGSGCLLLLDLCGLFFDFFFEDLLLDLEL